MVFLLYSVHCLNLWPWKDKEI